MYAEEAGLKSVIMMEFGKEAWYGIRNVVKWQIKKEFFKLDIDFLKDCKKEGIVPSGLNVSKNVMQNVGYQQAKRIENSIMEATIGKKKADIKKAGWKARTTWNTTTFTMDFELIEYLRKDIYNEVNAKVASKKHNLDLKHIKYGIPVIDEKTIDNWKSKLVIDATREGLSKNTKKVLELGLDFCVIQDNQCDKEKMFLEKEIDRAPLDDVCKNKLKTEIATLVPRTGYLKGSFGRSINKAKSELNDKVIVQGDKAKNVLVMEKAEFQNKVNNMLKLETYRVLDTYPINIIEKQILESTRRALKLELMDTQVAKEIKNMEWRAPSVKLRAKTHKNPVKFRMIIDSAGSVFSKMENWLKEQLRQVWNNKGGEVKNVSNTYELIEKLKRLKLKESDRLMSLDVVDMYGSIPRAEVLEIIQNLDLDSEVRTLFVDMLKISLDLNYFVFDRKVFSQIEGLPMGNSLSGLLADIRMKECDELLAGTKGVKFYNRYVDDLLIIFDKETISQEELLNKANCWNSKINFTMEAELNNKINYLDITLSREIGKETLSFARFWKECNVGKMIDARSAIPWRIKKNVIVQDLLKTMKITGNPAIRVLEFERIYNVALLNGYTKKTLNECFNVAKNKWHKFGANKAVNDNGEKKHRFLIPTSLTKYKEISSVIRQSNLDPTPYAICKIKDIFKPNYIKEMSQQCRQCRKGLIYEIECDCKAKYIGETGKRIDDRMRQHMDNIRNVDGSSALVKHLLDQSGNNCCIRLDKAKILDWENNTKIRKYKEAEIIKNYKKEGIKLMNMNDGLLCSRIWGIKYKTKSKMDQGKTNDLPQHEHKRLVPDKFDQNRLKMVKLR